MQRPRSNKRKNIRDLARKATERAQGGNPPPPESPRLATRPAARGRSGSSPMLPTPPSAPTAKPAKESMKCICGKVIQVEVDEEDEKRCSCPNCNRRFDATVVLDPQSGKREIFPMFLDDAESTGETFIAQTGTDPTVGNESDMILESAGPSAQSLGLTPPPSTQAAIPPAPSMPPSEPAEMTFTCYCGKGMRVRKPFYRSRVKCPGCSTRLFLNVNLDPIENAWKIAATRVGEPPTGDTRTMPIV